VLRNVSLSSGYRLSRIITNVGICVVEKYQRNMIHALKEVQGDENIVGFYQTTSVPLRQSLVETQATDYGRLRHGGIVIVHGAYWLPRAYNRDATLYNRGANSVIQTLYKPTVVSRPSAPSD
jgi:hypothetical protein